MNSRISVDLLFLYSNSKYFEEFRNKNLTVLHWKAFSVLFEQQYKNAITPLKMVFTTTNMWKFLGFKSLPTSFIRMSYDDDGMYYVVVHMGFSSNFPIHPPITTNLTKLGFAPTTAISAYKRKQEP